MSTNKNIPYGRQWIDDDDVSAVKEALLSPFLTTGPKVREFEAVVAKKVNSPYAVSFSSGTAALHGAMVAAGIGPGDEVLVPTLSFLATANAVVFVGARPVFVDIEPGRFNMDLKDAERKITAKTKAIVPVHFAGEPVDLNAVHKIAKAHKLLVIEDAAHALGAKWQSRPIGGLSDMTALSFHPVKHITTGEGGMVTTNNEAYYSRLKQFRHHGIDVDATSREASNSWNYDMVSLGYNYRLTDIQSALGISQLAKLDEFLARRQEIAALYDKKLKGHPRLILPRLTIPGVDHAWHLYIITLTPDSQPEARDLLFRQMRESGIGVNVHYRPIHLHSFYQKTLKVGDVKCLQAENVWTRILSLPIFPALTDEEVNTVCDRLISFLDVERPTR